jgi:hypothetical protein
VDDLVLAIVNPFAHLHGKAMSLGRLLMAGLTI